MKVGVVFPQTELPLEPHAVRDYAQAIEGMGFDYVLAYDHVLGATREQFPNFKPPYTKDDPFHEVFVLFGYLAGITTTLEFATGVLILPQRQTALVAKQAAQIDYLSGGRLRLGIGVGWNFMEYQALGRDFKTRGKRTDVQLAMLNELWTKRVVNFAGDAGEVVENAGIYPLPIQRPIPIWFGGMADPVLRRMAKWGVGWMPPGKSPDDIRDALDQLHNYLREEGRDPANFGIDVRLNVRQTPNEWRTLAQAWQKAGATHICLHTMNNGLNTVESHLKVAEQFKQVMGEFLGK
jgi:probable F420-dependent oxidoreductase